VCTLYRYHTSVWCVLSPTYEYCSFVRLLYIANSRKSYKTLQTNRLIFPAIVRDHDYILYSAVCCQRDNSLTHPHCIRFCCLLYLHAFYPLILRAMGLSAISLIILCYANPHHYINNTRGYLRIFQFSPPRTEVPN